jgi:hypothetical protein
MLEGRGLEGGPENKYLHGHFVCDTVQIWNPIDKCLLSSSEHLGLDRAQG